MRNKFYLSRQPAVTHRIIPCHAVGEHAPIADLAEASREFCEGLEAIGTCAMRSGPHLSNIGEFMVLMLM